MRKTFMVSASISSATGMIGNKIVGTVVAGEMYLDGNDSDFQSPIGKNFTISGKVLNIQKQEAIDLLKKYDMYDKVVGVEVGGIKVWVDNNLEISGTWKNDKIEVQYSSAMMPGLETIRSSIVKIKVLGFFNSMALDNIVVIGGGSKAV